MIILVLQTEKRQFNYLIGWFVIIFWSGNYYFPPEKLQKLEDSEIIALVPVSMCPYCVYFSPYGLVRIC